jgi:hypothetical protein
MFRAHTHLSAALLLVAASTATADDRVVLRDRGTKGTNTLSGKIESESLGGIRIAGQLVPIGEVVDVQYDMPPALKLDYPRAVAAESRSPAEAIPLFEAILRQPTVQNNAAIKRHVEFRIAMLIAARADEGRDQLNKAVEALRKFKADNADTWQLLPLTRTLVRLDLDRDPPDYDAARKAYEDLAAAPSSPAVLKADCTLAAIDLLSLAGKADEAKQRAAGLPLTDPRSRVYQIGHGPPPAEAVKHLDELIDRTSDRALKATAYNMLGDVYRRDAKTRKEAVYAYLWVDLIYNDDPAEVAKADARLATLFGELKDEDRAKRFRDKARGK